MDEVVRGDACDGVHALPLNMCRPAGRRGAQRTDACWDGGQEEVYTSWRGLQTEVSVETASYQLLASVWWEGWKTEELQQKKKYTLSTGGIRKAHSLQIPTKRNRHQTTTAAPLYSLPHFPSTVWRQTIYNLDTQ